MALRRKVSFKNHEPKFPAPLEGYAATVELPEGHHVTIGELTPGTIVEVATWEGTGKPDQTTRRFLISADGSGLARRQIATNEQIADKPQIANSTYSLSNSDITTTQPIADPIFGRNSDRSVRDMQVEKSNRSGVSSPALFVLKVLASAFIFTLAIGGVLKFGGIGVTTPSMGASSFFGSSTNSLVFYQKQDEFKAGSAVVAIDKDLVVLGTYGGDIGNLSLFTLDQTQMSMPKDSLVGRSVMLIPFLGTLLKPILT